MTVLDKPQVINTSALVNDYVDCDFATSEIDYATRTLVLYAYSQKGQDSSKLREYVKNNKLVFISGFSSCEVSTIV